MNLLWPTVLALAALAAWPAAPVQAGAPAAVCARVGTDDTLRPIPQSLVPAVNGAFGTAMPAKVAMDTTVFRCARGRVLVCTVGANLPCGRANTNRTSGAGAVAWCRGHPGATFIPAFATGHDTIFARCCRGGTPEIARQVRSVSPRGFISQYWKTLPERN